MLTLRKDMFYSRPARMLKRLFWYPLRRVWWPIAVKRAARSNRPPVLVYQVGKVASSSIYISLKRVSGLHVFHAHYLSPHNIDERRNYLQEKMGGENVSYMFDCSEAVYRGIIKKNLRIKIITLVREPIARNISGYFHGLSFTSNAADIFKRLKLSDLADDFIHNYPHFIVLNWFDNEFKSITGVDIYAYQFPKEQGYQFIHSGRFDILIMRHDLDVMLKKKCLCNFLDLTDIKIVRKNAADDKSYSTVYKKFIQSLKLEYEFVEKMLDSKYSCHFYSLQEREEYKDFWTGGKST